MRNLTLIDPICEGGGRRPGRRLASVQRQEARDFSRLQVAAVRTDHEARARRRLGNGEGQGLTNHSVSIVG